jgi:hypothetical protein
LKERALRIWKDAHPEYMQWRDYDFDEDRQQRIPKFSSEWSVRFLKVHNLGLRKADDQRRSVPNDRLVVAFVRDVDISLAECDENNVINMDETCCRILPSQWKTVARRGAEAVSCEFEFCEKSCITDIAGISASGQKLPIWVIRKGTTRQCELRTQEDDVLREAIDSGRLFVTHSKSGWMDKDIAGKYIAWLRETRRGPLTLIWDQYSGHKGDPVESAAIDNGIHLIYIPAGQTDYWQPLDRRIFGNLKGRARGCFNWAYSEDQIPEVNMMWALRCLLQCWEAITREQILDSWSIYN